MDPVQVVLFVIAGFVIGIFSGLLGIGGGTLMVPVLRLGFALEAVVASATSLFTIVFTSIGGTVTHLRNKTALPKLSLCLGIGGAITSSLGAMLGNMSPSWAIMLVAAVIIAYSAFNMLRKAIKLPKKGDAHYKGRLVMATSDVKPNYDEDGELVCNPDVNANVSADDAAGSVAFASPAADEWVITPKLALAGFGIGLIAGLASGYVGVGGGFIMVPLMTAWLGVPMHKASGTSLIAIMILAIPGVLMQVHLGNVDYIAGICLACGSIPGAMFGARFVTRIPERSLRFVFAGFLGVAALSLVLNELGVF